MGTRGGIPKRDADRRRRNLIEPADTIELYGPPVEVPALRRDIHPLAASWYAALAESGQSIYYEPSDWMAAQLIAEAIADYMTQKRPTTLAVVMSASASLLVTEGDRRRVRLELTRSGEAPKAADVIDWRARASSGT